MNTHAPSPYSGEGLYEWLRNRETRWASLAIIHRLDKETSGVLVFTKTPLANRSLTDQFSHRAVRKKYLLITDREVGRQNLVVKSCLTRAGEKYVSRPLHATGELAETRFRLLGADEARKVGAEARSQTGSVGSCTIRTPDSGKSRRPQSAEGWTAFLPLPAGRAVASERRPGGEGRPALRRLSEGGSEGERWPH